MYMAYLLAEISDGFLNRDKIHGLGVPDHGSHQAFLSGNCNADVHVVPVDNGVTAIRALNRGVHCWDIPHGQDARAGEGAHEPKLDAGLLQHIILVEFSEFHERGHVNLVERCE
jgi:hypothetical protein